MFIKFYIAIITAYFLVNERFGKDVREQNVSWKKLNFVSTLRLYLTVMFTNCVLISPWIAQRDRVLLHSSISGYSLMVLFYINKCVCSVPDVRNYVFAARMALFTNICLLSKYKRLTNWIEIFSILSSSQWWKFKRISILLHGKRPHLWQLVKYRFNYNKIFSYFHYSVL